MMKTKSADAWSLSGRAVYGLRSHISHMVISLLTAYLSPSCVGLSSLHIFLGTSKFVRIIFDPHRNALQDKIALWTRTSSLEAVQKRIGYCLLPLLLSSFVTSCAALFAPAKSGSKLMSVHRVQFKAALELQEPLQYQSHADAMRRGSSFSNRARYAPALSVPH
jgi:hypothetical protein